MTDPIRALGAPGPMLLVLLGVLGCGGDSSGPNENDGPLTLESGTRVSQMVLADGATLSTLAGDGTRYTLAIPAAAIRDSAAISMTPILAATGVLGEAGLIAGIRFEPEGLVFARPATLTIELPAGSARGYATVADGDGSSPNVVVSAMAGRNVTVAVSHFSVAAVVERADAIPAPPAGAVRQAAEQVIGTQLGFLTAPTPESVQTIIAAFHNWYASSVRPKLQAAAAAGATDVTLVAASSDYSAWLVAVGMAGVELGSAGDQLSQGLDAEVTEGRQLAAAAFEAGIARNNAACLAQPTNLGNAFAAANNVLYWQEVAASYILPPDYPSLQRDAVLDGLCLSVVIDAAAFPEQIAVGETYPLNVRAGYAIGGAAPILTFSPLQAPKVEVQPVGAVAASAAEPLAGLTDGGGTFATSLSVEQSAVVINVHACALGALTSGRLALAVCTDTLVVRNGGASLVTLSVADLFGPHVDTGVFGNLDCDRGTDLFDVPVAASLTYTATTSCSSSGTEPSTGQTAAASATAQHGYTVVTSTGTTAGNLISIRFDASSNAHVQQSEGLRTASASLSGMEKICFQVPQGMSGGWQIAGSTTAGSHGWANIYMVGSGGANQEIASGSHPIALSGRFLAGDYCFRVNYGLRLQSSDTDRSLTESQQVVATLTFGP